MGNTSLHVVETLFWNSNGTLASPNPHSNETPVSFKNVQ
jgi:hypothetical protein